MIFVTVGTHEQQFDRLIREIDEIKGEGIIKDEVFIQSGYSDYIPKNCNYKDLITYQEMQNLIKRSNIVITHGGPGSIMTALQFGKIPIVVPRQKKFGEHVDDHQVLFSKRLNKIGKIHAVYDISDLKDMLLKFNSSINNVENSRSNLMIIEKLNEITIKILNNKNDRL